MANKLLKFTARNHITDRWLQHNPDVMIECWSCGKPVHQTDPRQKYCNRSCARKYYRRQNKPIYDRLCGWCDKDFTAFRSDKIYCSKNCISSAARLRKAIPRLGHFKRRCRFCLELFIVTFPVQRYCNYEHFRIRRKSLKRYAIKDDDIDIWNQMREKFWFGIENG